MDNDTASIIVAQFSALRDEILLINTSKFMLLQAKYVWIAGVLGGLYFIQTRKNKFDNKEIFLILNLLLFSLLPYDLAYAWLDCQVNTIGAYIQTHIENIAFKSIANKLPDNFVFWETFFKEANKPYRHLLSFSQYISIILPSAGVILYIALHSYKTDNKLRIAQKLKALDTFGLINLVLFTLITTINIVFIISQIS